MAVELNREFGRELARATRIVAAIKEQIVRHYVETRKDILEVIEVRRAESDFANSVAQQISLPQFEPRSLEFDQPVKSPDNLGDATDGNELVGLPAVELRHDHWTQFVETIKCWTSVVEASPRAFGVLEEPLLRDLLLASLRVVYPFVGGEVLVNGLKSDIYVQADGDPSRRPAIAELKKWKGPVAVKRALDQHLGQLTVRHTRGLLLEFIEKRDPQRFVPKLMRAVETHPGFTSWASDTDAEGWPVAVINDDERGSTFEVTIGYVLLEIQEK